MCGLKRRRLASAHWQIVWQSQALFVGDTLLSLEHFIALDDAPEGVRRDLIKKVWEVEYELDLSSIARSYTNSR